MYYVLSEYNQLMYVQWPRCISLSSREEREGHHTIRDMMNAL